MTLVYTNCMCSPDKQKVFYSSGLQELTVENLFPPATPNSLSPFLILSQAPAFSEPVLSYIV